MSQEYPSQLHDDGSAVCAECGKTFPAGDMIRHGNAFICASCKPVFMQKLSEGARVNAGNMNYAGFWIRFAASFVDGILLQIVAICFRLALGFSLLGVNLQNPQQQEGTPATRGILIILSYALAIGYETFFIGKFGATVGKMVCKVKVVTAEGEPVSYLRAFGRYFAKILSALILLIGYIMAGFDEEKRALHDRICNTRVVYK